MHRRTFLATSAATLAVPSLPAFGRTAPLSFDGVTVSAERFAAFREAITQTWIRHPVLLTSRVPIGSLSTDEHVRQAAVDLGVPEETVREAMILSDATIDWNIWGRSSTQADDQWRSEFPDVLDLYTKCTGGRSGSQDECRDACRLVFHPEDFAQLDAVENIDWRYARWIAYDDHRFEELGIARTWLVNRPALLVAGFDYIQQFDRFDEHVGAGRYEMKQEA